VAWGLNHSIRISPCTQVVHAILEETYFVCKEHSINERLLYVATKTIDGMPLMLENQLD
jgi:hypothetical protein